MKFNQHLWDLWHLAAQLDWVEMLNSISAIGMLSVAIFALGIWRKQEKSKRTLDLFDKLTDAIHEHVYSMSVPIQKLEFIFIGIDSLQFDQNLNKNQPYSKAIRFIENEGKERSRELFSDLTACSESAFRIKSLIIKGQAMNIDGFSDCQRACKLILWQHERIQAFAAMLGMVNANWKNSEVSKRLSDVLEINPQTIRDYLNDNQIIYLNYVQNIYKKEYKGA